MDILDIASNKYSSPDGLDVYFSIDITRSPLTTSVRRKIRKELKDKWFVEESLKKILKKPNYHTANYKDKIKLHYIATSHKTSYDRINRVMYRLVTLYDTLQMTKPITIWFIPCPEKKTFPEPNEQVGYQHMNGGYTYTDDNTIFVYRQEEFPKVFVHELIHNSYLNTEKWNPEDLATLYREFQIDDTGCPDNCQTDLRPNEAVVEVWTLLFHLSFVSLETKIPYQKLLHDERLFSLYQTSRIFNHQRGINPWKESTHSYSYIVFKTIILLHIEEFLRTLTIPYNSQDVIRFLIEHKDVPLPPAKYKPPRGLKNSMRMTVYGDKFLSR